MSLAQVTRFRQRMQGRSAKAWNPWNPCPEVTTAVQLDTPQCYGDTFRTVFIQGVPFLKELIGCVTLPGRFEAPVQSLERRRADSNPGLRCPTVPQYS